MFELKKCKEMDLCFTESCTVQIIPKAARTPWELCHRRGPRDPLRCQGQPPKAHPTQETRKHRCVYGGGIRSSALLRVVHDDSIVVEIHGTVECINWLRWRNEYRLQLQMPSHISQIGKKKSIGAQVQKVLRRVHHLAILHKVRAWCRSWNPAHQILVLSAACQTGGSGREFSTQNSWRTDAKSVFGIKTSPKLSCLPLFERSVGGRHAGEGAVVNLLYARPKSQQKALNTEFPDANLFRYLSPCGISNMDFQSTER